MQTRKVLIIGGGPAGLVAAIWLAMEGWEVHCFEKGPEPTRDMPPDARGFAFTLNFRGLSALPKLLRDAVLELSHPIIRRVFITPNGCRRSFPYGDRSTDKLFAISRADFLQACVKAARDQGVNLHFKSRVEDFDPVEGVVTYRTEGADHSMSGDLIICADGSRSMSRSILGTLSRATTAVNGDEVSYVALTLDEKEAAALARDPVGLHFYNTPGAGTDILIPTGGKCTLLVISAQLPSTKVSRCDAHEIANGRNPCILAAIPDFASRLAGLKVGHFSTATTTNPVALRAVLVGDAHSTLPAYTGQGVNASLHDVHCLVWSIRNSDSLEEALENYAASRQAERQDLLKMNSVIGELLRTGNYGNFIWRVKERFRSVCRIRSDYHRLSFDVKRPRNQHGRARYANR